MRPWKTPARGHSDCAVSHLEEGGQSVRELGRVLRSTRESLGYDLDEIEEKTKIRKRYLLALEEGDWSVLPGRVYARGFVRSYADVLGLDGLELLQQYVDGRETDAPVENPDKATTKEPPSPVDRQVIRDEEEKAQQPADGARKAVARISEPRPTPTASQKPPAARGQADKARRGLGIGGGVGQGLIIVAALAVVAGGYFAIRGHHASTHANAGQTPVVNNTTETSATAPATTKPTNTSANAVGNSASVSNNTTSTTPAPAVVVTTGPMENGAHTYAVQNVKKLQVKLQVSQGQCWISVTADGSNQIDPNDIVNPGETRTFTANQTLQLNLGHVQGVQVTVNGKPLTMPDTPNPVNILIQKQP